MRKGKFPFHCRGGGEAQALTNIRWLEIRIFGENLRLGLPAGKQSQHRRYGDAEMTDARDAAHLRRVHRDAFEVLHRRTFIVDFPQ